MKHFYNILSLLAVIALCLSSGELRAQVFNVPGGNNGLATDRVVTPDPSATQSDAGAAGTDSAAAALTAATTQLANARQQQAQQQAGYTPHSCLSNAEKYLEAAFKGSDVGDQQGLSQLGSTMEQTMNAASKSLSCKDLKQSGSQAVKSVYVGAMKEFCVEAAEASMKQARVDCQNMANQFQAAQQMDLAQQAITAGTEFTQFARNKAIECKSHSFDAANANNAIKKNMGIIKKSLCSPLLPIAGVAGALGFIAPMLFGNKDKKDTDKKPSSIKKPKKPDVGDDNNDDDTTKVSDVDKEINTCNLIADPDLQKSCLCKITQFSTTTECSGVAEFNPNGSPASTDKLREGSAAQEIPSESPATTLITESGSANRGEFVSLGSDVDDSGLADDSSATNNSEFAGVGGDGLDAPSLDANNPAVDDGEVIDILDDDQSARFAEGDATEGNADVVAGSNDNVDGEFVSVGDNSARTLASKKAVNEILYTTPEVTDSTMMKIDPCSVNANSKACRKDADKKQKKLQSQHSDLLSK